MIELAAALKLIFYLSLIACVYLPYGMAVSATAGPIALVQGAAVYLAKLALLAVAMAAFEVTIAKMRVFRVGDFLGAALMLGFLATLLLFVSRGV